MKNKTMFVPKNVAKASQMKPLTRGFELPREAESFAKVLVDLKEIEHAVVVDGAGNFEVWK